MSAALAGVARPGNREPLVIRMLGLAGGSLAPASLQLSAAAIGIVQLVASSVEASMVDAGSVEAGSAPRGAGSGGTSLAHRASSQRVGSRICSRDLRLWSALGLRGGAPGLAARQ